MLQYLFRHSIKQKQTRYMCEKYEEQTMVIQKVNVQCTWV